MQVGVARTDVSVDRQRIDGPAHVNGHTMANGLARTGCVKVGVKEFGLTRLIPGAFTDRYDSGQLTYGDFGRKFDATGFGVDINVGSVLDTARCGVVRMHSHGVRENVLDHRRVVKGRMRTIGHMRRRVLQRIATTRSMRRFLENVFVAVGRAHVLGTSHPGLNATALRKPGGNRN